MCVFISYLLSTYLNVNTMVDVNIDTALYCLSKVWRKTWTVIDKLLETENSKGTEPTLLCVVPPGALQILTVSSRGKALWISVPARGGSKDPFSDVLEHAVLNLQDLLSGETAQPEPSPQGVCQSLTLAPSSHPVLHSVGGLRDLEKHLSSSQRHRLTGRLILDPQNTPSPPPARHTHLPTMLPQTPSVPCSSFHIGRHTLLTTKMYITTLAERQKTQDVHSDLEIIRSGM